MIVLATLGLAGLVVFEVATTLAALGKLRVAQRWIEETGGLPDPLLPPRGTRVGPFRARLAPGSPGEITGDSLRARTVVVGFFTSSCLSCEAVCEELEERPPGAPLIALVHAEPSDPPAAVARIVARLAHLAGLGAIAQVGYLDADVKAAFAFRDDSGFPTLIKLHDGLVVAAGHGLAELS